MCNHVCFVARAGGQTALRGFGACQSRLTRTRMKSNGACLSVLQQETSATATSALGCMAWALLPAPLIHPPPHTHTLPGVALFDITPQIRQQVQELGVTEGFVNIISRHTTTAVTINEHETRLLDDIRQVSGWGGTGTAECVWLGRRVKNVGVGDWVTQSSGALN